MRTRCIVHIAAQCFWFGLLLPALNGANPPPQERSVVLRSTTRLVELTVVVRNRNGQPVTDLKEADFTVEDEGKRQEIRFFSLQSDAIAGKGVAPAPPGVFSNRRFGQPGLTSGITVILLDGLNTRWGDQALARKNVIEYLCQIQPHDRVALYTLGRELKVLHDFTEEPAELN
jgi:VWFA-related protein